MKFAAIRETLLKPLQLVSGVVEKRQTLPILSNILMELDETGLTITATDLEMEVKTHIEVDQAMPGKTTVPVRKFLDTCKTLPEDAIVKFDLKNEKALLNSGKTRFSLTTLSAEEFPVIDAKNTLFRFNIAENQLKRLIEKTQFAMAIQDVRYYLNGMLLKIETDGITTVATDGHRLALSTTKSDIGIDESRQAIVPRKGIMELLRLLEDTDRSIEITIGENFFRAELPDISFTTKLIDGKYPSYDAVIPKNGTQFLVAEKESLKQCLVRTSILSNEKYRGIRIELDNNTLKATANNPEQEEAIDEINV
ncbi:MAG: DNA polymerase III subunit beta, partial [Gammaproteobacteria bacterium]|nr:DNA polymerase III subunit beta [Gammaproteobacteria bacterium]